MYAPDTQGAYRPAPGRGTLLSSPEPGAHECRSRPGPSPSAPRWRCVGASAAAAQPSPHAVAAKKRNSAVKTVTRMLTGVYLTTYTSGNVTGASAQSTVHLCGGGRFLLISSSDVSTVIDDPSSYDHPSVGGETRTTGNWKVLRARFARSRAFRLGTGGLPHRRRGRRQRHDRGGPGGVTVGGQPAEAGRSSACG